jgi:hypothetical protein
MNLMITTGLARPTELQRLKLKQRMAARWLPWHGAAHTRNAERSPIHKQARGDLTGVPALHTAWRFLLNSVQNPALYPASICLTWVAPAI